QVYPPDVHLRRELGPERLRLVVDRVEAGALHDADFDATAGRLAESLVECAAHAGAELALELGDGEVGLVPAVRVGLEVPVHRGEIDGLPRVSREARQDLARLVAHAPGDQVLETQRNRLDEVGLRRRGICRHGRLRV